jgi:WD40 repeat protein
VPAVVGPSKTDAFISYTRQQGRALADDIQRLLSDAGLSAWRDRTHMRGGEDFRRQIEQAIGESRYLVMVLTPDAFADHRDVLREEWLLARRRGVPIVPVYASGAFDWTDAAPPWLRRLHLLNIDDEHDRQRFITSLRSTPDTIRVPHNIELPHGYVSRQHAEDALVQMLTSTETPRETAIVAALRGPGGFGKSTLASAVCFNDEVLATFTDGVLRIEIGTARQEHAEKLRALLSILTGEPDHGEMAEIVEARWRELVRTRRCLVVLDDVWGESEIERFIVRASRSAFLIVTRLASVAATADRELLLDRMAPAEAAGFLGRDLGTDTPVERAQLEALATHLGCWPVLLRLAARRLRLILRRGATPQQALTEIEDVYRESGVTGFDVHDAAARELAVAKTLAASLSVLDHPSAVPRYHSLAVLPDDEWVSFDALADVWEMHNSTAARRAAEQFEDVALLDLHFERGIRVHDVFLHYLQRSTSDLAAAHEALLNRWGDPHHLPHAYAWRWFGWHCLEAGRSERLRQRLLDVGWLKAKLFYAGITALLGDFERLERPGTPRDSPAFRHAADDSAVSLLGDALRKSAHVLLADATQLEEQLFGRLRIGMSNDLDLLIATVATRPSSLRLRARYPNLEPAGSPLIRTLAGHQTGVNGVLALPDGRVVSWASDSALGLWDLRIGDCLPLTGHSDIVNGALLTRAGDVLSWGGDGTLRRWDLVTGTSRIARKHNGSIQSAQLLSDGRILWWGAERMLCVSNLAVEGDDDLLTGHEADVHNATEMEDGRILSWSMDGTLRLWDLVKREVAAWRGDNRGVYQARPLPGGQLLTWGGDHTVRLWDLERGGGSVAIEETAEHALLRPDGRVIYSAPDRVLKVWDVATRQTRVFTGLHDPISIDADRILASAEDDGLRCVNLATGEVRRLYGRGNNAYAVAPLEDGRLLSWGHSYSLWIWNLHSGNGYSLGGHSDVVLGAMPLPDDRALTWSNDGKLRVWDLRERGRGAMVSGHDGRIYGSLLLPDYGAVLSWGIEPTLRLWDLATGQSRPLVGHQKSVWGARVLTDGRILSWSADRTLRLWDPASGAGRSFEGHDQDVLGAMQLPEGRVLSWSADGTMRVWDQKSGGPRTLFEDVNGVWDDRPTTDGELLTSGLDGTIWLSHPDTGARRLVRKHQGSVRGVRRLPNGGLLSWAWFAPHQVAGEFTTDGVTMHPNSGYIRDALLLDSERVLLWGMGSHMCIWNPIAGNGQWLAGHEDDVDGALLLPDRGVLSWSRDRTLRVWDASGRERGVLKGHRGAVNGGLLTEDGRVMSWATDDTLRLWDLERGSETAVFYLDAAPTVVLPYGSNRLFVGDKIGRVHFLEYTPGQHT